MPFLLPPPVLQSRKLLGSGLLSGRAWNWTQLTVASETKEGAKSRLWDPYQLSGGTTAGLSRAEASALAPRDEAPYVGQIIGGGVLLSEATRLSLPPDPKGSWVSPSACDVTNRTCSVTIKTMGI